MIYKKKTNLLPVNIGEFAALPKCLTNGRLSCLAKIVHYSLVLILGFRHRLGKVWESKSPKTLCRLNVFVKISKYGRLLAGLSRNTS